MTAQKCVVEGCDLEYDVICSFSFYNVNTTKEEEKKRQEWIDRAMEEESECLWRHVSLQLCGYHFELDNQGLWIDSPMLPELLANQEKPTPVELTEDQKKLNEIIHIEHNYSGERKEAPVQDVSRLNVRSLVDTLGYLSLKNLQRKQLWVVKVETDKAEASITQAEQVITKMQDPKQVIEILPPEETPQETEGHTEVLQMIEDPNISDNFIYEIAEEQEITMEEVKEIPATQGKEWIVNVLPDEQRSKYAYIKHCSSGKKKRHFTADMNQITLQGDFENYYILPDVDPSSSVEITTSYEPENYIVEEYQHVLIDERPKKRTKDTPSGKSKKKKMTPMREQVKHIQIKTELGEDWVIQNESGDTIVYDPDNSEDYDDKKGNSRVRRKNKKYLGYDFVT